MSALIFCGRCGSERCDCAKSVPPRCYSCSDQAPGWFVAIVRGLPKWCPCLSCNARGDKPRPLTSQPITAPS